MLNAGHILLADEDADLGLLIKLGFPQAGILNPVDVVSNGQEAIGYLNGEKGYAAGERPSIPVLALLDTRLRHVTGFEVLAWIRQQPALGGIRIVMFSSSGTETEAQLAQELGADCVLSKPFEFQELVSAVKRFGDLQLLASGLLANSFDTAQFELLRSQQRAQK